MKFKPMKTIRKLVVHCSATKATADIGADTIRLWHKRQGWVDIGYHYVIKRDGTVEKGRPDTMVGAHVSGHNSDSLGICLIGGIAPNGKAENNYTDAQFDALETLLDRLSGEHPGATILGHRDLSPDKNRDGKITPNEWVKECPCFDVKPWWAGRKGR